MNGSATLMDDTQQAASALRRACLMGHPVAHSRSPMIHGHWLALMGIAGRYELQDVAPASFPDFIARLRDHGYVGGNVTVPHKEAAFRGVDERDAAAEAIGAVNTVWFENGKLMGGNSDAPGFIAHLDEEAPGWQVPGAFALILGAGGGARAAVFALLERGVEVAVVNRTLERARTVASHFGSHVHAYAMSELPRVMRDADLFVNCTPLGMAHLGPLDVDLAPLKPTAVVYDLVYVPLHTALLVHARERGLRTVDGLGMLLHQAGFGFQKWFGIEPKVTRELRAIVEADLLKPR